MKISRLYYFSILWFLCMLGFFAVLPFLASLTHKPLALTLSQFFIKVFSIALFYGIIIFIGAKLSIKRGIRFFLLEPKFAIIDLVQPGFVAGIICAFLLAMADIFIFHSASPTADTFIVNPLYGFGGAFYGAINEEVNLRLFFCSVIASLCMLFFKNRYHTLMVWTSIIISSFIFGIGHLHAVTAALTPLVVAKILLLNGLAGIIFGWLFWYRGFEVAVCAHFTTDVILFVVIPILRPFIV